MTGRGVRVRTLRLRKEATRGIFRRVLVVDGLRLSAQARRFVAPGGTLVPVTSAAPSDIIAAARKHQADCIAIADRGAELVESLLSRTRVPLFVSGRAGADDVILSLDGPECAKQAVPLAMKLAGGEACLHFVLPGSGSFRGADTVETTRDLASTTRSGLVIWCAPRQVRRSLFARRLVGEVDAPLLLLRPS